LWRSWVTFLTLRLRRAAVPSFRDDDHRRSKLLDRSGTGGSSELDRPLELSHRLMLLLLLLLLELCRVKCALSAGGLPLLGNGIAALSTTISSESMGMVSLR
jgi:hypothetical protein